jgi:hypothetical protein
MYYALQFDKNYLYINQIEHDFNAIQLFQINNASSSKLISSTAIDLTDFRANSPDAFLSYAVDHINNNLIIFYTYSETQQHINTFVIDLDDLTTTETHKMTVPNELFLDLSAEEYAAFSIYKGKLIFSCTYTADNISTYEIVGIDYLDSTNYIIYESNLDYNLQMQRNAAILFNDNDTLISSNLILKNDHAYIVNNNSISSLYFYDSSKIININNNNMVEVLLSPLSVATINKLSKTIIKTAAEKIKIKYRIVRERV